MREVDEIAPILGRQRLLSLRYRRARIHRSVTRQHALAEQRIGLEVGRVLKISIEETISNPLFEKVHDFAHVDDRHHALDLPSRTQLEAYGGRDPKQSVTANHEAKELRVFLAATSMQLALGVHQGKRLHFANDRLVDESPPVRVGRQRSSDAETVGPGLLLDDAPWSGGLALSLHQIVDDCGPLGPGTDLDFPFHPIELEYPIETVEIQQHSIGSKLLSSHRVSACRDTDRLASGS